MDQRIFDDLTRAAAAGVPRRALLRGLLGGVLGGAGLLGPLGRGRAAASHGCRHAGATCSRDGQCCSGDCRNGTCRCTRAGQCPQPAASEPCKKAVCTATGRCALQNRANDAPCSGGACQDGACVASCVPDCSGKVCGDDGCGGTCGTCPPFDCNRPICSEGGDSCFYTPTGVAGVPCNNGTGTCDSNGNCL